MYVYTTNPERYQTRSRKTARSPKPSADPLIGVRAAQGKEGKEPSLPGSQVFRTGGTVPRIVLALVVSVALVWLATGAASAQTGNRVTGGGESTITELVLADGSTIPVSITTHFGFAAIGHKNGAVSGQFQCLITGPGFTGSFMNLHGTIEWLVVSGDTAWFGGDSNFGPFSVVVTTGLQPHLSLRWTDPFGPGAIGAEETVEQGSITIR
jgi:hypothetical protein